MSAPFCTGCGATVAAGTRFCVKCGQPVGQAAPPPASTAFPTTVVQPVAPPPPPPPKPAQFPVAQDPAGLYPAPKQGPGAGLWVGLFGVLLLICGAGLWYGFHAGLIAGAGGKQVASAEPVPPPVAAPVAAPAPSPAPANPPPNPDFAKPEAPPPNPDFAKNKSHAPAVDQPVRDAGPKPTAADPAPPVTPKPAVGQTTGTLHAAVEVQQNGEVVFENLPAGRLRFTYDHTAWQPTIHRQANGTQTLIMRSLKAGVQRSCDVQWEIVQ
jgi:hypothetical protein